MNDANLDLAVEGILWGAFGTTGQRCTACSRVIAQKEIKKQLEEKLIQKTKKLKLGNGLDKKTDVGPLINSKALEKTENYCKIGRKEGKLLCGGKRIEGKGFFFEPTIFTNVKPSARIAQEEIFGPVLSIIPVSTIHEAIRVANEIEYGLSSAIYTESITNAMLAIEQIEAGITYVNSQTPIRIRNRGFGNATRIRSIHTGGSNSQRNDFPILVHSIHCHTHSVILRNCHDH